MKVSELILELQFMPQDLEVSIVDYGKKKFKEERDIKVSMASPEYADPYVQIQLNNPE